MAVGLSRSHKCQTSPPFPLALSQPFSSPATTMVTSPLQFWNAYSGLIHMIVSRARQNSWSVTKESTKVMSGRNLNERRVFVYFCFLRISQHILMHLKHFTWSRKTAAQQHTWYSLKASAHISIIRPILLWYPAPWAEKQGWGAERSCHNPKGNG